MRKFLLVPLVMLGLAALPKSADAEVIGTLNLGGDVRVTVGGLIDFIPPLAGGHGIATVGITSDGIFAVLRDYNVQELDLQAALFPAGPEGTFAELLDFETFAHAIQDASTPTPGVSPYPDLTLSLTSIVPCEQGCGFGFAPQFNVIFTGGNTSVLMNVTGNVYDSTGLIGTYTGQFSAQFPGIAPGALLAELVANTFIETTFSASKITARSIPEPATLALLGLSFIGLGARARRRAFQA